jgi:pectate lyase
MMYLNKIIPIAMIFSACELNAQQPAFPSAEGFGKYATEGRNGTVYHVTNLDDSGPGSFRDAVSQSNRIVVFDAGGVIHISSRIVIQRNVTVAGQTAPGDGVTIYGNGIALNDNSGNDIIRYIRIRMGKNGDEDKDAVGISAGTDYMFDHVSVSWGRDGTFDINGTGIDNISIQDCIISQGINNQNHSTGGLIIKPEIRRAGDRLSSSIP